MDQDFKEFIDRVYDEGVRGASQPRESILRMLAADPLSEEVLYMRERANELARIACDNKAVLSGAVGVDMCSCDMNCKFCSFGTEWDLIKEDIIFTKEQVIALAKKYVEAGVTTLTLRSTEFYDLATLAEWLKDIRAEVPGGYLINLNVGEMTPAMAEAAYQAGATSAYHVNRMREGIDTPFDPALREETIMAISNSPLRLSTGVEPVGIEHTDEEIADKILRNLTYRPYSMCVMLRINVPGTPFEGYETVSHERMLQLIAVARLACGTKVRCIATHPATPEALRSGANSLTVECGANPRDVEFNDDVWRGFKVTDAVNMFLDAGFDMGPVDPDPRFRADGNNWWVTGDPAQYEMPDPRLNATGCCGKSSKKK